MIFEIVLPLFEEEAKKRQLANLKQGNEAPVMAKIPERESGASRDHASKTFDVSARYIQDVKKLK